MNHLAITAMLAAGLAHERIEPLAMIAEALPDVGGYDILSDVKLTDVAEQGFKLHEDPDAFFDFEDQPLRVFPLYGDNRNGIFITLGDGQDSLGYAVVQSADTPYGWTEAGGPTDAVL